MEGGHPIDDAVCALREVRTAYKRLFDSLSLEGLEACRNKQALAVKALRSDDLVQCVNDRIDWAVDNEHETVSKALFNLQRLELDKHQFEQAVAHSLGFNYRQTKGYIREARRSLQRAQSKGRKPKGPRETAVLIEALERLEQLSTELVEGSRKIGHGENRQQKIPLGIKRKRKSHVRKRVTRDLMLIGSIVANGKHQGYFHYSYAISLGLTAANE